MARWHELDDLTGGTLCTCLAGALEALSDLESQLYQDACFGEEEDEDHPLLGVSQGALAARVAGLLGMGLTLLSMLKVLWRHKRQLLQGLCSRVQVSQAFQEKILEYKVSQMRGLIQTACYLLLPVTAWVCFKGLAGGFVVGLAQTALALGALFPQAVTTASFDAAYCGCALLVVLAVSPMNCCDDRNMLATLCLANMVMAALTSVRRTMPRRVPLMPFVNGAFGAAATASILANREVALKAFAAGAQVAAVLLLTLAAPLLERFFRSWLYRLLQNEDLQELLAASQGLLQSSFDVVVELDTAAGIVSKGPELGALLLRDQKCMEGQSFLELLDGELMRICFQQRLANPQLKEVGLAEHMRLVLKDSCSNCLQLEATWFAFSRMGEERHYMLGLREEECGDVEQAPRGSAQSVTVAADPRRPQDGTMELALSETSSVPEMRTVSSGSGVDAGAVLVVDGTLPGFPVTKVSANFRLRVCPLQQGQALTNSLKRPTAFQRWLIAALSKEANPSDREVLFKTPQGRVRALCKLLDKQPRHGKVSLFFYSIHVETENENPLTPLANRGTSPTSPTAALPHTGPQSQKSVAL